MATVTICRMMQTIQPSRTAVTNLLLGTYVYARGMVQQVWDGVSKRGGGAGVEGVLVICSKREWSPTVIQ